MAKHCKLLRDDGLLERQRFLKLVNGAPATHEKLENANAGGVGERAKELSLERLKFAGYPGGDCVAQSTAWRHWTIIFRYCYDGNFSGQTPSGVRLWARGCAGHGDESGAARFECTTVGVLASQVQRRLVS